MALAPESRDNGALPPPPGVQPNFTDPPNKNLLIITVASLLITLSTICVAVRTYTRLMIMKQRDLGDYLLWIAWLLSVIYMLMCPLGLSLGLGVHQWNVTRAAYSVFLERYNIADLIYSPTMTLVKLSILKQLHNVFAVGRRGLSGAIKALSGLTVAFYLACMISRILACVPREKIWNPGLPGSCTNSAAAELSSAALNVVLDLVLFLIPVTQIWKLQMRRQHKVAVSVVFATALLGCVASVMRIVFTVELFDTGDRTYGLMGVGLWCDAEITAAITCCCFPVFPRLWQGRLSPFLTSLRSRFLSSTVNGSASRTRTGAKGLSSSSLSKTDRSSRANGGSNALFGHKDYLEIHEMHHPKDDHRRGRPQFAKLDGLQASAADVVANGRSCGEEETDHIVVTRSYEVV